MTAINPALNFTFASAEAFRLAAAERGAEELVASQLRQAAEQAKFSVGTTITARYQYQVGVDGALVPIQTQITTDAPQNSRDALAQGRRNPRQPLRREDQERPPSFKDLSKPKPDLSPTDELVIFANPDEAAPAQPTLVPTTSLRFADQAPSIAILTQATAVASDENGDAVEAELFKPDGEKLLVRNEALLGNTAARAQFSVATLYARNYDITYKVMTTAQLAA